MQTTNYRLEDYLRHRMADSRGEYGLSDRNLYCAHLMFDMYLDFLVKQKWARIKKLHRDRLNLPIASFRRPILDVLSRSQVVVVAGDTGCGKSTQVPQYLAAATKEAKERPDCRGATAEEDCRQYRRIAVTQPRKIACISLAARVSTEMLCERGTKVGYQVRFEKHKSKATQILFLTEGLLLRQMQSDPFLKEYDVVVLDEVHERHWQTDCLLGLMKCLVLARPEIRLVLMSATINVNLFASFFDSCPIIQVPGRLFPITVKYCPLTPAELAASQDRMDPAPYVRLLQHIDVAYPVSERGDLLVFLPGMAEIQAVMEACKAYAEHTKRWIILPLHSALPARSQEKIFHSPPDGVRKCVLATNIAETSVTIDGIRFVADSGRVKELTWDALSRMRRLKETAISQASANQRKGRAGRTGPGVCFRLFQEEEYRQFQTFTTPEIRRVPLDILVLQMMAMGLPDVKRFPFIEPPEMKSIDEALQTLVAHGALARATTSSPLAITPLGKLLADLPVDLSLGRMLIMASLFRLVEPVLSLAAGLAVQNPVAAARSGEARLRQADALKPYDSDHGTPFMIAELFDEWVQIKSNSAARAGLVRRHTAGGDGCENSRSTHSERWCRRLGLEEQRLYEVVRLRTQFLELLRESGLYAPTAASAPAGGNRSRQFQPSVGHRRALRQAQHREHLHAKRRRLLTLQDNADDEADDGEGDASDEDDGRSVSLTSVSRLHQWLSGSGKGGAQATSSALCGTGLSVRDLELVLCHNVEELAEWADHRKRLTKADIMLLKVVLTSGLYPQLAIPDPANAYRVATKGGAAGPGAEMLFHTPTKAFVMLQPTDVFVRQPDCLFARSRELEESGSVGTEGSETKPLPSSQQHKAVSGQFASDHQLLAYLDLLETTKPYLVNTIRVPALPTLLLYAREIDTNANVTRIVFDRWIEVELLDAEAAQRALAAAIWLRTSLDRLLKLKLAESQARRLKVSDEDSGGAEGLSGAVDSTLGTSKPARDARALECRRLQRLLREHLAAFLGRNGGGLHTLKKLHAADVKKLFKQSKPAGGAAAVSTRADHVHMNPEKGGYQVTPYLTIDSLYAPAEANVGPDAEEADTEAAVTSRLSSLELALRLHAQVALALEAGQGARRSGPAASESADFSAYPKQEDAGTGSQEEGEEEEEYEEDDGGVAKMKCPQCGKRLPANASTADLLRHKKRCST
uniref:Putative ATP-dependent RNA helicase DHX34 n=2 Tax=Schistocephalus solidus TaxID=70667 RepID=A0A0V0J9T0_SCHSO